MGFPGTLGASYIPYLVADTLVAPPEYGSAYTEKMLFLPRRFVTKCNHILMTIYQRS